MHVHRHHQLEVLLDGLALVLDGIRPDAVVPDVVIVASAGAGAWVEQQLALRMGVCANIRVRTWDTVDSPWSADRLAWEVLAELQGLSGEPELARLRAYVAPEHGTRRQVLVAGQIAGVVRRSLDRGRTDWTRPWLARLVAQLTNRLGPPPAPPPLPDRGRIALLCPTATLVRRLDPSRDVHVFHLAPSTWDHPLAAATGRNLREVDEILACASDPVERQDDTALHRLQSDLCGGTSTAFVRHSDDRSVLVHDCHGETRELEVLRDEILRRLQADETLQPRDILVLCADLRSMAPRIDHVFSQGGGDGVGFPKVRFDLADRSERAENPVAEALLGVLDLCSRRLHASALLDLLAIDPIRRRFGLDEAQLGEAREWIETAGIRWGRDAAHRARESRPAADDFTWRNGLDRLLLGLATADDTPWAGVLPVDAAEGGNTAVIYGLVACVEALIPILDRLDDDGVCPGSAWRTRCEEILDAMVRPAGVHRWQEVRVRQEIGALAEALDRSGVALDRDGFRVTLAGRFEGLAAAGRFAAGGVTFAQLAPHRAVPHRVVALVGMGIDAFPRRPLVPEFDPGDDPPRERDRQAFLLALLAAREALIVTWSGHDARSNAPQPPSVLVSELLDTLGPEFVVAHPLHAWSPDAFAGDVPSLDRLAWAAASASRRPQEPRRFWQGDLPAEPLTALALRDLVAFVQCPPKFLLERRLRVVLSDEADAVDDDDPEDLKQLAAWTVRDELLAAELRGADRAASLTRIRLAGRLPLGVEGDGLGRLEQDAAVSIAERARALIGDGAPSARTVSGRLDGVTVHGRIGDLFPTGRVLARASDVRPKYRLDLWVHHLAACAFDSAFGGTSWLVGRNGTVELPRVAAPDAARLLGDLVALYREGQTRPLAFATDSYADAYLELAFGAVPELDLAIAARILGPLDAHLGGAA